MPSPQLATTLGKSLAFSELQLPKIEDGDDTYITGLFGGSWVIKCVETKARCSVNVNSLCSLLTVNQINLPSTKQQWNDEDLLG